MDVDVTDLFDLIEEEHRDDPGEVKRQFAILMRGTREEINEIGEFFYGVLWPHR